MSDSSSSSGFPIISLLGVVFVTLKLCHVIDSSWLCVTLPFWGGLAIIFAMLIIMVFVQAFEKSRPYRRR